MRPALPLLALSVLLVLPAASACSIAWSEFDQAGVGGDRLFLTRGPEVHAVDLATLQEDGVGGDWFTTFAVDPTGRALAIDAQEGLGADCSGDPYFRIVDGETGELRRGWIGDAPFAVSQSVVVRGTPGMHRPEVIPVGDWFAGTTLHLAALPPAYHDPSRVAAAVDDAGRWLALASEADGQAALADLSTGEVVAFGLSTGAPDGEHVLAFSPDANWLAVAAAGEDVLHVRLWAMPLDGTGLRVDLDAEGFRWPPAALAWAGGTLIMRSQAALYAIDASTGDVWALDADVDGVPGGLARAGQEAVVLMRSEDAQSGRGALWLDAGRTPTRWLAVSSTGFNEHTWTAGPPPDVAATRHGAAQAFEEAVQRPQTTEGPQDADPVPPPGLLALLVGLVLLTLRRRNAF